MNDKYIKEFIAVAQDIRFRDEERLTLRNELIALMRAHPIRDGGVRRGISRYAAVPFRAFVFIAQKPIPVFVVFVAVLLSGGVSYAAEQSVPGDVLYPIKVSVNEEFRGAVILSREGDAEWEIRRLERRLEEAEVLARRGGLDEDIQIRIEQNFSVHAERIKDRLAALEERGNIRAAAELGSNLEVSLSAHERILERLAAAAENHEGDIRTLVVKIKKHQGAAESGRLNAETKISSEDGPRVRVAAEGRLNAAEHKMSEVWAFMSRWQERLGADAIAGAEARLALAGDAIAEGKVKLEAGAYGEAFALFQRAHRIIQEAQMFITASHTFEISLGAPEGGGETEHNATEEAEENSAGSEDPDEGSEVSREGETTGENGATEEVSSGQESGEGVEVETEIELHLNMREEERILPPMRLHGVPALE